METVLRPLSFVATLFAAAWLVWRLRNVHDSTNLSRDIGLVGRSLVVALCECSMSYATHATHAEIMATVECIFHLPKNRNYI